MIDKKRILQLIDKGKEVLKTYSPNPPGMAGFPTLDIGKFTAWKTQTLNYLISNLSEQNQYVQSFKSNVRNAYQSSVEQGIEILKALIEDLDLNLLTTESRPIEKNPIELLYNIFEKFHLIARQLRNRYNQRPTLDITDEYDVQDLLHSLLHLYFDDIRPEEWTPSYAGKSSRMDFLLKEYKIVIEVKKTRKGLTHKELGGQLIEDIARYKVHPDCETLICFVYDPEGLIGNPKGIENDLSRNDGKIKVKVIIKP